MGMAGGLMVIHVHTLARKQLACMHGCSMYAPQHSLLMCNFVSLCQQLHHFN
jgi:hypothetical protein